MMACLDVRRGGCCWCRRPLVAVMEVMAVEQDEDWGSFFYACILRVCFWVVCCSHASPVRCLLFFQKSSPPRRRPAAINS